MLQKKYPKKQSDSDEIFSDLDEESLQKQPAQTKLEKTAKPEKGVKYTIEDGQYFFEMGQRKKVCISRFKGRVMVSLREYFEKDGKELPTKKGISLNPDNWAKLKEIIQDIDDCIAKVK